MEGGETGPVGLPPERFWPSNAWTRDPSVFVTIFQPPNNGLEEGADLGAGAGAGEGPSKPVTGCVMELPVGAGAGAGEGVDGTVTGGTVTLLC